ncbi:MAG: DUF5028 domain-containing protein [Lachnospiraceae bacterium]|nr:DUF5028 domain-containing protein [Lachnospiraceae bacterium]
MRNRAIKVSLLLMMMFLLILGKFRYEKINSLFPKTEIQNFTLGEEVEMEGDILMNDTMEGYSIKVESGQILPYEAFLKEYNLEDVYSHVPEKIYLIEVILRNKEAEFGTGVNLSELYLQKGAICASIDLNLYSEINTAINGVYMIALRPDSEIRLRLPFALYESNFSANTWTKLEQEQLSLVVTLYPTKKVIFIQE